MATAQVNFGNNPPMDGSVALTDLTTGKLNVRLIGHHGDVTAFEFLEGGRKALSTGMDGTIRLWDVSAGVRLIGRHPEAFEPWRSPNGRYAATASGDCTSDADMRKLYADKLLQVRGRLSLPIAALRMWGGGTRQALCCGTSKGRGWRASRVMRRRYLYWRFIQMARLVSAGGDEWAYVYRLSWAPFGIDIEQWSLDSDFVSDIAFNKAATRVAIATESGSVWSLDGRGSLLYGWAAHGVCIEFSPDQSLILTTSPDESIRLWNAKNGDAVRVLESASSVGVRHVLARWSANLIVILLVGVFLGV